MNIKNYLRPLIAKALDLRMPTRLVTIVDSRSEPPALAQGMSADRIIGVISAAEMGQTRELFSLYRDAILTDSHLQSEITKRKLAALGDTMSFMPFDRKLQADIDTANLVDSAVSSFKGWMRACSFLLDSSLFPVSVVEKVFEPTPNGYKLASLIPVPYQLLDFTSGHLMIYDADPQNGQALTTKHEPDPNHYIVHRGHLLSAPDNWGGPMRSILFWWLLSAMDREWWAKFLEKYGTPFLVGKFQDEDGRSILERAFALASRLGGLVISDGTEVEIMQAATGESGDAYEKFITICQREKSKLVLGQTMSSEAQAAGMGSGQAKMQEDVRQDIRRFDCKMLAETLRDQLLTQYCQINRLPGAVPLIAWGSESQAKIDSTIGLLKALKDAGLQVTDDALYTLSEKTGLALERAPVASGPLPFVAAYSVDRPVRPGRIPPGKLDSIADKGSADLAQMFRGTFAPIAQIIRASKSPEECEQRVRTFCAELEARKSAVLISDALSAYAINGTEVR